MYTGNERKISTGKLWKSIKENKYSPLFIERAVGPIQDCFPRLLYSITRFAENTKWKSKWNQKWWWWWWKKRMKLETPKKMNHFNLLAVSFEDRCVWTLSKLLQFDISFCLSEWWITLKRKKCRKKLRQNYIHWVHNTNKRWRKLHGRVQCQVCFRQTEALFISKWYKAVRIERSKQNENYSTRLTKKVKMKSRER